LNFHISLRSFFLSLVLDRSARSPIGFTSWGPPAGGTAASFCLGFVGPVACGGFLPCSKNFLAAFAQRVRFSLFMRERLTAILISFYPVRAGFQSVEIISVRVVLDDLIQPSTIAAISSCPV